MITSRTRTSITLNARHFSRLARGAENELSSSPLSDLKRVAQTKNFCDNDGFRLGGKHWTFVISGSSDPGKAPSLRTVTFQKITNDGIHFISKNNQKNACIFSDHRPVSFLYTVGKYTPGETVTQWRACGVCEEIPLKGVLNYAPTNTVVEMVASSRVGSGQSNKHDSGDHHSIQGTESHFTEIVQQTRRDFQDGDISIEELNQCIKAWKFVPSRMEKMVGNPDAIMWDRWEYEKEEGSSTWCKPKHIMPF